MIDKDKSWTLEISDGHKPADNFLLIDKFCHATMGRRKIPLTVNLKKDEREAARHAETRKRAAHNNSLQQWRGLLSS